MGWFQVFRERKFEKKLGITGERTHEPECLPVARLDRVNLAGAARSAVAERLFNS